MKRDVTEECIVKIERYHSGVCGFQLMHEGNNILSFKLSQTGGSCYTKLYDINKGYEINVDTYGNFNVFLDEANNKICPKCGHLLN